MRHEDPSDAREPAASSASREAEAREFDAVFSAAYEELRRLAASVRSREASATLNPTALVHEAWLKLRNSPHLARTSPLHFKRIAARAMRQVLVEAGRRRQARKRGGREAFVVTLEESEIAGAGWADDVLALDAALASLARLDARQALLVESRFFAGLSVAEAADLLGISEATALRDWRAARAWLAAEMRGGHEGGGAALDA